MPDKVYLFKAIDILNYLCDATPVFDFPRSFFSFPNVNILQENSIKWIWEKRIYE